MAQNAPGVPDVEALLALAREREFEPLEAAWMARLEKGPREFRDLFSVADYLVRKKFPDHAALLLWSLVADVTEKEEPPVALEVAIRAAEIAPEAQTLREEIINLYRKVHPGISELADILEASDLRRNQDVKAAVQMIQHCLRYRTGSCVIHTRSRRVGRVDGFEAGQFLIASEGNVQRLAPREAVSQWEPLDPADFRAMIAFQIDALRRMAEEDPAALVQKALRVGGGRADFKQLKFLLIPAVIPADKWSAWWNAVKVILKRCPLLEIGTGTQPTFVLRSAEASYADKVLSGFRQAETMYDKVRQALTYLAELEAGHEADPKLAAALGEELLGMGRVSADQGESLACLSALAELRARFPELPDPAADLLQRLTACKEPAALMKSIDGEEISRMILGVAQKVLTERWPQFFADAFVGSSLRLCDWIVRELAKANRSELLAAAADKVLTAPEASPETTGWVWRWALSGEGPGQGRLERLSVSITLLDLMNRLAHAPRGATRADQRKSLGKLSALASAGDFRLLRDLIGSVDLEAARRLHTAIVGNEGLGDEGRHELLGALRERYPEEFTERKNLWEDAHLYTSAAGLARRTAEMEKLANVDMPANAQAIGTAAARGDLRENWEYKTALEERDRLVERATRMRDELSRARVLHADQITGNEVNVGTAARLRNRATGAERTVRFVGPWDTDIANGVYSYMAPLSLRFMGKKVGDRIAAAFGEEEGEFEIVAIEKIA